jgi:hypothetical protein
MGDSAAHADSCCLLLLIAFLLLHVQATAAMLLSGLSVTDLEADIWLRRIYLASLLSLCAREAQNMVNVSDYVDVSTKLTDLGCNHPTGFALLPSNFESAGSIDEFRQASEAATVKTLFRAAGIPHSDIVDKSKRPPYIHNNAIEWIAPTLFVSASLLSNNPELVSGALGVISTYVADFLKGATGKNLVKLNVVVEKTKTRTCKEISYEGDAEGLRNLTGAIQDLANG